eukprot:CAMPEP_0117475622 /NCGR_PEP_ID=MMETSP0784-20121206/9890_1 /TAXON_ID=39447 /ORGANISM="" /LENGTH=428 /DNA_ID=CAMNT_0005269875 /DNA_START=144 /DNA_END=1431 /DNA_ORIENTATION=-
MADARPESPTFKKDAKGVGLFPRDAGLIFNDVWMTLVHRQGGETRLTFPKEIIWLNGAPGAGKSTNTAFISLERSIVAKPVVVSALLTQPEMEQLKAEGFLVGDRAVTEMLFAELMDPRYKHGAIVDGYPRTPTQAAICKMLYDKLSGLHRTYKEMSSASNFLRPVFRIVVLYVDGPTSVSRQLKRGKEVELHNARVQETGVGEFLEARPTDKNESLGRRRYKTFLEQSFEAVKSLSDLFVYNLINAGGPIEKVRKNIEQEMQYQSSVELNPETFNVVSQLELASEITMNARQLLVQRMDEYALRKPTYFGQVAESVKEEIYPVIRKHAISGRCSHVSHLSVFVDEIGLQMAIDILSERGFRVTSEPVVRGTKFDIAWDAPDKLGSRRFERRAMETASGGVLPESTKKIEALKSLGNDVSPSSLKLEL